ncbi:hypothetical protein Q4Q34_08240 [Flavivirga abyssicola]|uniref:hypothetical protein n=1 Tax=Flavivirga abyssicola TaxID=3063533 RepID=UPI0026E07DFB|nr:hypothetical protein [Flavivirga sp. MEBiC07777]WVK15016.1 hypothetical protein Q4Q34_08240 [Flavivirga sp. MEBiC07777]
MKKVFLAFAIFSSGLFTYSQEKLPIDKEKEVDEIIDSLLENDILDELIQGVNNFKFLYVSVDYNSDTYFSGRDIGIDQYNIRPQITYMHSKGYMFSLSGIYYNEFVPKWDYTAASIGYSKSLGKNKLFRLYAIGSRYFYSNGVNNPFHYALTLGSGITNKQRTIGTQLSGTYLFGNDQSFQITSTSYASFKLLKTKKSSLKLKPELNIVAGKQTFELAQTTIINGVPVTNYLENNVFNLINTQINIPLEFSTNSFEFEFGYNINLPSAIGTESNLNTTGFFNFSIAYLFDL